MLIGRVMLVVRGVCHTTEHKKQIVGRRDCGNTTNEKHDHCCYVGKKFTLQRCFVPERGTSELQAQLQILRNAYRCECGLHTTATFRYSEYVWPNSYIF
jgi:hypothetical protein